MEPTIEIPFDELARQLKLTTEQVTRAIELLDAGHSVPFLALFRLDQTHGLGEGSLVRLADRVDEYRQLEKRKAGLLEYLRHRNLLDSQIEVEVVAAENKEQVDQLYAIYKRGRPPKGAPERIEPVAEVARRVIEDSIDPAELDAEYARLASDSEMFGSLEDVRAAVREQIVQCVAHSVPLRVCALRILRETGAFECQRFHEAQDDEQEEAIASEETTSDTATEPGVTSDPVIAAEHASSSTGPPPGDSTPAPADHHMDEGAHEPSVSGQGEHVASEKVSSPPEATRPLARPLAARKSSLSVTEERRQKRKQARMRRRAHLEAALKDYFNKSFPFDKLTIHQFSDIDYGERVRVLSTRVTYDEPRLEQAATSLLIPESSLHGVLLLSAWTEAKSRFILPDCERIIRREFSERMEHHIIQAVKRHVRSMCMQRPLRAPLLAITAHRDGFSLVAVDQAGHILASQELNRNEFGPDRIKQEIKDHVARLGLSFVAVEAAERTRLIQQMLADTLGSELKEQHVGWLTVADDGLINYCRSATGCEEIPGVSPEQRAAIAIARRAQNPLAEFVKVDPRDWLSEQQQSTVNVQRLRAEIEGVYQSCLARIGVDVNRAEPSILRKLPGLDEPVARRIEAHRMAHGEFKSISELSQLPDVLRGLGEWLGYVRVRNGIEPLDAIGIHPEHYGLAERLLGECGISKDQLRAELEGGHSTMPSAASAGATETSDSSAGSRDTRAQAATTVRDEWDHCFRILEFQKLGESLDITREHARRLVNELRFAARDVRENSRLPVVRYGALNSENLEPGDLLAGRVVNTTSFGAFVEIAPGTVGLIHVSRLGDGFVRDPQEVLMDGERIPVWILSVDRERKRIALSLSPPGTDRPAKTGRAPRKRAVEQTKPAAVATSTEKPRAASGSGRGGPQASRPRKPKFVVPITEEMKAGREPMRTFGDLKQFFEIKSSPKGKSPSKKPDSGEQETQDSA